MTEVYMLLIRETSWILTIVICSATLIFFVKRFPQ